MYAFLWSLRHVLAAVEQDCRNCSQVVEVAEQQQQMKLAGL